jgi:hypothetical protein
MSSSTSFGSGVFGTGPLGTQPFFNVSELIDSILYATGHGSPAVETTKRRAILQFINNRYQQVCTGTHWRWLKASYDFNVDEGVSTGTVALTEGSEIVTGTGTNWTSSLVKAKDIFFVAGSSTVYHVASLDSPTQITLETKFSEDSVTGTSYNLARNQYVLPTETDNLISWIMDSQFKLVPLGPVDFRQMQAQDPTAIGTPKYYSMIRRDTDDDSVYAEVWPAPDKRYQSHIDYTVRIARLNDATTCYPIIPDRYRSVLYYGGLSEFYNFLRDPSNSASAENSFMTFLTQMKNDTQMTDDRFQISTAKNYYRRTAMTGRKGITTLEDFGKEG